MKKFFAGFVFCSALLISAISWAIYDNAKHTKVLDQACANKEMQRAFVSIGAGRNRDTMAVCIAKDGAVYAVPVE